MLHENKRWEIDEVADRVRWLSLEHSQAWVWKLAPPLVPKKWKPPPADVIKINVDVAIRSEFAMVAAILRDSLGNLCGFKQQGLG